MKLISWNINGFRSLMNRTLLDAFARLDADVYCLQETKLQAGQGDRKSTRLNSSHYQQSRMPSSA